MNAVSPLVSDQPSKVFTPQLQERLELVLKAQRSLNALGVRVVEQDLRIGSTRRPLLTIASMSNKPLNLRSVATVIRAGQAWRLARYMDVDITYPVRMGGESLT